MRVAAGDAAEAVAADSDDAFRTLASEQLPRLVSIARRIVGEDAPTGPEGVVIGLDFLPEMLERTHQAMCEAGLENIETLEGEMEAPTSPWSRMTCPPRSSPSLQPGPAASPERWQNATS